MAGECKKRKYIPKFKA